MKDIQGINIIGFIAFIIISLLILFILTVKTKHKLSNRLFATFLILTAFDISGWMLSPFITTLSNFTLFIPNLTFLQLPVFYLYILSACYSDFKLSKKHLLHGILFLIVNIILIPRYFTVDLASKSYFIKHIRDMIEIKIIHISIHIQILFYFVLIFLVLKRYKKLYLENYTNSADLIYKWLLQMSVIFASFHFIALLKNIFKYTASTTIISWMQLIIGISVLSFICWYVLKALNNPDLFRGVNSKLQLIDNLKIKTYRNTDENTNQIQTLKSYMINEKPFLNPYLTMQILSEKTKIPSRELSVLINQELGQHFFDFINLYRIEEAMGILKDRTKKKHTILEILYEVGFNSKSSFNTAFKKHTGKTPTNYRKLELTN